MTPPGIGAELAAAVRRVNALYSNVPEEHWPPVNDGRWQALESEVDAASEAGDVPRALEAIRCWENFATARLSSEVWR